MVVGKGELAALLVAIKGRIFYLGFYHVKTALDVEVALVLAPVGRFNLAVDHLEFHSRSVVI